MYLRVERRSYGQDAAIAAYGTAAAIAQVVSGKKVKALKKFAKALQPVETVATASETKTPGGHGMDVLRSRVRDAVRSGEMA